MKCELNYTKNTFKNFLKASVLHKVNTCSLAIITIMILYHYNVSSLSIIITGSIILYIIAYYRCHTKKSNVQCE